ncbi:Nucleolar protein 9 [Hypsizygus marmoreus]|uniref:Nucleolar protein 9 n=1 Tax=Hypsizygus marmoreus TaxID=39966 RepID=A0A369JGU2_HYPMA|nr:Nucleolar protein 9 [Hypsizygus marmoreus]
MPRENRKRGKKNKKRPDEEGGYPESQQPVPVPVLEPESTGEPSWIRSAPDQVPEINPEAPFGYVDADVKAYFRTVDGQIRDWQEAQHEDAGLDEDIDPNEQRRLFFVAALTEMGGKEKQLATDPDCSVILERMAYSMDDFVRRVFLDSLVGSYELLVRHRFASHVCQTLFTVAKDTVSRETRGIFPTVPESSEHGELRTLTQLVLDVSEEILPTFSSLIMDPFASHVIRALLLLLSPNLSSSDENAQTALRSKKSAAWKARQGPMKSVFTDEKGKGKEVPLKSTPPEFRELARRFVEILRADLGENEVRALAANKVACPGLQMLLEVEADHGMADEPGSLMDRVTVGIISACRDNPDAELEPSDYLNTLLRDPTSSHLLETIVMRSPEKAFGVLWSTYFKGKLGRLANHPVANFVLAKAMERVTAKQLSEACVELEDSWGKMIRASRTGVLRAVIDRSTVLSASEQNIAEAVYSAFDLVSEEDHNLLVPCVLHLLPLKEYKAAVVASSAPKAQPEHPRKHGQQGASNGGLEQKVQGAILLQALLRLPDPHNQIVLTSLASLSIEERIKIAHNANGSRVYDVLLESPTVPSKSKRQFVMDFIGHYHLLVDNRIGSRVGDRCWSYADTYLKEKIARSLFSHEQFLAGSYYGKFFARNLNLYLLQRRPDEWKTMQADRKRLQDQANKPAPPLTPAAVTTTTSPTLESQPRSAKRKRHTQPEDEIDAVFNATLGKRIKKAALGDAAPIPPPKPEEKRPKKEPRMKDELQDGLGDIRAADAASIPLSKPEEKRPKKEPRTKDELQDVLGAIRAAPKDEKARRKRGRGGR